MSENLNIKLLNFIIQKINTHKRTNKEMRLTITNQTKSLQINKICKFINEIVDTDNIILYELFDIKDAANREIFERITQDIFNATLAKW